MGKAQSKKHPKYYMGGVGLKRKRKKPTQQHRLNVAEKYIKALNDYLVRIGRFEEFTSKFEDAAFEFVAHGNNQCSFRFLQTYNFYPEFQSEVSVAGQVEGFIADGKCRPE